MAAFFKPEIYQELDLASTRLAQNNCSGSPEEKSSVSLEGNGAPAFSVARFVSLAIADDVSNEYLDSVLQELERCTRCGCACCCLCVCMRLLLVSLNFPPHRYRVDVMEDIRIRATQEEEKLKATQSITQTNLNDARHTKHKYEQVLGEFSTHLSVTTTLKEALAEMQAKHHQLYVYFCFFIYEYDYC